MANVTHSPKSTGEKDNMLASIQAMIGDQTDKINGSIDSLRISVENRFREIEGELKKVADKNAELKERNADLEKRKSCFEMEERKHNSNISNRMLSIERDSKSK